MTPTNKALILANLVVWGLQFLLGATFTYRFALWPPQTGRFEVWQLLTYGFLHDTALFVHILFNLLALYMFGSQIERVFGPRRYLLYYLVCVVGAALMHIIVVTYAGLPSHPVVGASGGVYGLLLAYGVLFPKHVIIPLFPPIPMPAWLVVILYGLLELYLGVTQTLTGIAHFAHLGGMATGFVLIRYWSARRRKRREGNQG